MLSCTWNDQLNICRMLCVRHNKLQLIWQEGVVGFQDKKKGGGHQVRFEGRGDLQCFSLEKYKIIYFVVFIYFYLHSSHTHTHTNPTYIALKSLNHFQAKFIYSSYTSLSIIHRMEVGKSCYALCSRSAKS